MPSVRVLLVDDEPLALTSLVAVCARDRELEVVGTCTSGNAALKAIRELAPDLVLLDVQMPGMDGIEVARRIALADPPAIVFVTAHDTFAIAAFEVHALDYVLKPFTDERLLSAIERAKTNVLQRMAGRSDHGARLLQWLEATQPATKRYLQRLAIQDGGRVRIVMSAEIKCIRGAKNYVEVHTDREVFLHRQSLDSIEDSLDPEVFVRIHRSTIVRLDRVREVQSEGGSKRVLLDEGTRLAISQTYLERLMARLS